MRLLFSTPFIKSTVCPPTPPPVLFVRGLGSDVARLYIFNRSVAYIPPKEMKRKQTTLFECFSETWTWSCCRRWCRLCGGFIPIIGYSLQNTSALLAQLQHTGCGISSVRHLVPFAALLDWHCLCVWVWVCVCCCCGGCFRCCPPCADCYGRFPLIVFYLVL